MERVQHIDALGGVVVRKEIHEPCRWQDSGRLEHGAKRHTGPFGNGGPAFLAGVLRNLRSGRKGLQLRERKAPWPRDPPLDPEAPVRKRSRPNPVVERSALSVVKLLVRISRIRRADCGARGDVAAAVLAYERLRR